MGENTFRQWMDDVREITDEAGWTIGEEHEKAWRALWDKDFQPLEACVIMFERARQEMPLR